VVTFERIMTRLPKNRPPTHPGEILLKDFIEPHGLTRAEAARRLGMPYAQLGEIVRGRRGVSPETALRLERLFGASAAFWLDGQRDWDLWHALRSPAAREIEKIEPIRDVA
jgi:antitoxin HigA-1